MNTDLIFDIGMHRGEDTRFYLAKGFRVVAIEANPALCKEVSSLLAPEIRDRRLTVINAAIAEHRGKAQLFVNDTLTTWSTLHAARARRNARAGVSSYPIEVEAIRMEDVFERFGIPYYMKVDIEGADWNCVEALHSIHDRPKYVSVEMNTIALGIPRRQIRQLAGLGYERFKIVSQLSVPRQREPNPPREGRLTGCRFDVGSSGLFGADLPGNWMSADKASTACWRPSLSHMIVGADGVIRPSWPRFIRRPAERIFWRGIDWFDIHATMARND